MRFSPIATPRRHPFRHRADDGDRPAPLAPTSEERRLIDRLLRRAGYRDSR